MKNKRKKEHKTPSYQPYDTLALADRERIESETNTAIPSESNVIQGKEWVDENKK